MPRHRDPARADNAPSPAAVERIDGRVNRIAYAGVGADQRIDWAREAASALEWWRDAGVDVLVSDDPFDWLAAPAASPATAIPATAFSAPAPVATATLPTSWDAFLVWRTGADAPESAWGTPPIAPAGETSGLMVLVDCPEREDRDALLSGAAGRLFDRMLAAIGLARADVHLASMATARPLTGRMPRDIEARLGEIARHHVALAAPPRLLVMGNAASRAVLATDLAEARGSLRALNHKDGRTTSVVATFHPRFLLERPATKADAWKDLQLLFRGGA